SRYASEQNMFEIGNVYSWNKGSIDEHTNLFMLRFAKSNPESELLGALRELFVRLGIEIEISQTSAAQGKVLANGQEVGDIISERGEIAWVAVEMDLEKISKHVRE